VDVPVLAPTRGCNGRAPHTIPDGFIDNASVAVYVEACDRHAAAVHGAVPIVEPQLGRRCPGTITSLVPIVAATRSRRPRISGGGAKAFSCDVEITFQVPSVKFIHDACVTAKRLKLTPLAGVTPLLMEKIHQWGTSWVEILSLTILAECAEFPKKALLGRPNFRPKVIACFICADRVITPKVIEEYSTTYPNELEQYWLSINPSVRGVDQDPSTVPNAAWNCMCVAGPNGIDMISCALVLWRVQAAGNRDQLERWGKLVIDVLAVLKVLLANVHLHTPQTSTKLPVLEDVSCSEDSNSNISPIHEDGESDADTPPPSSTDIGSDNDDSTTSRKRKPNNTRAYVSSTKKQCSASASSHEPIAWSSSSDVIAPTCSHRSSSSSASHHNIPTRSRRVSMPSKPSRSRRCA
jgi:hypothetical protein